MVGAPLVEEWIDRGVLWDALALMHGLDGGFVLELPHRFVGGLLLGWLRARSGSLAPGIVGHATWNALAVGIASWTVGRFATRRPLSDALRSSVHFHSVSEHHP